MAVSVLNTWQGTFSVLAGFSFSQPVGAHVNVGIANSDGNWLVAVACWQSDPAKPVTMAFGDDGENRWEPLGAPAGTSSPAGAVRSAIWAAPYAAAASRVYCSPSGYCPAFTVLVLEVTGMSPGLSLQAVDTGWVNPGTTVTLNLPAPAQQSLCIAAGAMNNNAAPSFGMSGAGWTALPTVVTSDGADHAADLTMLSGWQVTSSAVTATFTVAPAIDTGACAVALAVAQPAPAGPSQGWPAEKFEVAFGAGLQTPWDELQWTDLTARRRGLSGKRGRQYELDTVQASSSPVSLANNDGALTPGNTASPYYQGINPWFGGGGASLSLATGTAYTGTTSLLLAPDGVSSFPHASSEQVAVIAGQAYTGRAAVMSPVGWADGAQVSIDWYNASHVYLSTTDGTVLAVPAGQWVFPEMTVTAPVGAAFADLTLKVRNTPPAATLFYWDYATLLGPAGNVLNSNWSFPAGPDSYTPARLTETWLGRMCTAWRGFIERWPSGLSAARYTSTNATATDVYSGLTAQLPTVAGGEILNDNPWGWWPCSDAAGSTAAANMAPGGAPALTVVTSKYGPGPSGAQAFGGDSSAFPGAPSGCWVQSGLNSGSTDVQHGYCLQLQSGAAPLITAGLTIEAWHQFTGVQPNGRLVIWSLQGPYGPIAELWGDYDGSFAGIGWYFSVVDKGTRIRTDNRVYAFGILSYNWIHFAVTLTQTSWQLYIDAGGLTPAIASGTCNLAPSFQLAAFGGSATRTETGGMPNISLAGLALYPKVLTQTRIVAHYFGASTGLPGDGTGARATRLLGYAGMLVPRRLGLGADTHQPATGIQGQAAAQAVTAVAGSDGGLLYADRCGYLALDNRSSRWNKPAAWSVGEQAGGILNSNWDFETGISPWQSGGGGVTVAQSAAASFTGSSSMLVTPSAGASAAFAELVPVTAGTGYQCTARLMSPGGWASGGRVQVNWYNASGGYISTSTGASVPLNAGQWTPVTASFTAPGGALSGQLICSLSGSPASSNPFYADLAQLTRPGEVPYLTDFAPDFDPSQVANDITVSQEGGITVAVSSPSSVRQYGDRTFQLTSSITDQDVIADTANWDLAAGQRPAGRIAQFTVDAAANPYAWQFVLSADVGTVVQLSRRLQGTQPVIQGPFAIESVAPSTGPGQFRVTYTAVPYTLGVLATNDPVRGLPNGSNPVAY